MLALMFRFRGFLRPYRWRLSGALLALILMVGATLLEPWPLKVLIDSVLGEHPFPAWVPDAVAGGSTDTQIGVLCVALLVVVGVGGLLEYVGTYLSQAVGQRFTFDIREAVHTHLHRLSLGYHHSQHPGDLAARLTSDVQKLQDVVVSAVVTLVTSTLTLAGMLAVMFAVDWRFTLLALATTPLLAATVWFHTTRIKASSRHARKQDGRVAAVVQESLSAIHLVQAYSREDYEFERFRREAQGSLESGIRATMLQARFSPLVDFFTAVATIVVVWFGAHAVSAGTLTIGLLLVFISYLKGLYRPMKQLSKLSYIISRGTASAERLLEVLEEAPSLPVAAAPYRPSQVHGTIAFEGVSFRYPTSERDALTDVSFRIGPGEVTGLVGRTGAGKSTIVGLIPRFYDVSDGAIRVDDVDIRQWDQATLRASVSFVLQDTWLFQASIAENIAYGRPAATRKEIERVAREAHAHEFIARLPAGYDTIVGPRGATLSGGQRQRIAIARAMLHDAPILILDEPTSGLDPHSEALVLGALRRLMRNRTTLVIAHGEAPIIAADQILVIEDGRVTRRGSYDALSREGRRPWRRQGLAGIVGGPR